MSANTDRARVALEFRDGQWMRPGCDCSYHFWDGEPEREIYLNTPADARMVRLTGIEAPYLHLCEMHLDTETKVAALEAVVSLRPEVLAFAMLMEEKLKANDHKGGWSRMSPDRLLDAVREEVEELAYEIGTNVTGEGVGLEAADIANFAMMIADLSGALVTAKV